MVMDYRIDFIKARSMEEIRKGVFDVLMKYEDLLPRSKGAKIFLKPDLNSNMNALSGNTTDLRVIAAVIEFIKEKGFTGITIGEGPQSGFHRNNISTISRLSVDKLADYYGVEAIDLNYSQIIDIPLGDGVTVSVAAECLEADFFINIPKLKTHVELGMSGCLKNLMGCLVGRGNKIKTYKNLARNIQDINKAIMPQLNIVDALIAMEGRGLGTPINTGLIVVGSDPYLTDLVLSKLAQHSNIKTSEMIEDKYDGFIDSLDLYGMTRKFEQPKANPPVSFINSPRRQRLGKRRFIPGLRHESYNKKEKYFWGLYLDHDLCIDGCSKCLDYCPVGLGLPEKFQKYKNGCIGCLYCFLVCPTRAIEFLGELGFMAGQINQYDEITRRVA
jgi:uncharacterized protein (DUF362 family)/ferredoxin